MKQDKDRIEFEQMVKGTAFIYGFDFPEYDLKQLYNWHIQKQLELLEEIKCQTEIKVTEPPKDIKKFEKRQAWMAGQINVLCNYTELLDSKILSIKKELK